MKEKYIEWMERALSAYSDEHIRRYFDDVKRHGLKEHGFPRLTANIGILIAHGKRQDLLPLFLEMMETCCESIPRVKAANDFSVREIISCISELEQSRAVDAAAICRWKGYLATIDPVSCYTVIAVHPDDKVKNWALFTAVSEFFRLSSGLGGQMEFIELQLASQLQWMDANGMYMDAPGEKHHPTVYDLVPRGLFSMLLHAGYRGRYYEEIDRCLRRSGLLTLHMQSPNGEIPFGGRSNQFLHNEPWMIAIFEYEARRYAAEGKMELARAFKAAIKRAAAVTEYWLSLTPIYHVKNRFPIETKYGCEGYAYFDKYMITTASNLHAAYLMCDDSFDAEEEPDTQPTVFATTDHFHKLFVKAGGYGLAFDLNADSHYDACGLGRVQRTGAPAAICLSVPCPASPGYTVDVENPAAASLCPGVRVDGEWQFATDAACAVLHYETTEHDAKAVLSSPMRNGETVISTYTVDASGVHIAVEGSGEIAFLLPLFHFDGEAYTEIRTGPDRVEVVYQNWICRYTVQGELHGTDRIAANRNGHYLLWIAAGAKQLAIQIELLPQPAGT